MTVFPKKSCAMEVRVSYKFPLRPILAAATAGLALGAPMAAAAQDLTVQEDVIIVGAITDPANVEYVPDPRDDAVPELPVVHDDATVDAADDGDAAADDPSASRPDLGHAVETE